MTKIKLYIVTYNSDEVLKQSLECIYNSDIIHYDFQIFIINNYSKLENFNGKNLTILDNILRPDFSCGHLSRNWNQAIINGFKNLNDPDCDLVILMQNDTFILNRCFSHLIEYSKLYDFIQLGAGDQLMCFNVNAIKRIGIFDERFCCITFQEADYFFSAISLHKNKTSINDAVPHRRIHNAINDVNKIFLKEDFHFNPYDYTSFEDRDKKTWRNHNLNLFRKKWGFYPEEWDTGILARCRPLIKKYMYYPFFEKDIQTLKEQNYEIDISSWEYK